MPSRDRERDVETSPSSLVGSMRRHKTLPHPPRNNSIDYTSSSSGATRGLTLDTDVTSITSAHDSPRTLKHASRRIVTQPDLPPTPPAHSRHSSNDKPIPVQALTPLMNGRVVESPGTSTPPHLQSPPTPDVTPPRQQQQRHPLPVRPSLAERMPGSRNDSMNTTTSFRTAREDMSEDEASTVRMDRAASPRSLLEEHEVTPRPVRKLQRIGLGLEGLEDEFGRNTPTPLRRQFSFEDGSSLSERKWSPMPSERSYNAHLSENVTVQRGSTNTKKGKPYHFDDSPLLGKEVVEDFTLTPSVATKHLKKHGVQADEFGKPIVVKSTPKSTPKPRPDVQRQLWPEAARPKVDQTPDVRKFSNSSHKSDATVVQAAVVPSPPRQLGPRRTLRHMKKQYTLRDFTPEFAPQQAPAMNGSAKPREQKMQRQPQHQQQRQQRRATSPDYAVKPVSAPVPVPVPAATNVVAKEPAGEFGWEKARPANKRHMSVQSSATASTSSSVNSKSRRRIISEGAVPVVIVPQRRSSLKSQKKTPSLRSTTSSRRSKNPSVSSAPLSASAGTNIPGSFPVSDPPSLRQRRKSEASASPSVRSLDFPPDIPKRSSSLSAPTSRAGSRVVSRTNSLTAASLREHNASQALADSQNDINKPLLSYDEPQQITPRRHRHNHASVDTNGDPTRTTPFSASSHASHDTHGTALSVAEARQMDIFSHQNTSVQLVDQEPVSATSSSRRPRLPERSTKRDSVGYVTTKLLPPTPPNEEDDANTVESPLVNPRPPPRVPMGPPVIKFIPPTPAAALAAEEASKQLGYEADEAAAAQDGASRPSQWRRQLSLRLPRQFSLRGRNRRKSAADVMDVDVGSGISPPALSNEPSDPTRLHAFWRPARFWEQEEECDCDECLEAERAEAEASKNASNKRPGLPMRSFSQKSIKKIKQGLGFVPIQGADNDDDSAYHASYATARRTIKRSKSNGKLRVVKRAVLPADVSRESLVNYVDFATKRQASLRENENEAEQSPSKPNRRGPRTFSWVGGSRNQPAGAVSYPPIVGADRDANGSKLSRSFSLPSSGERKVQVQWLGMGALGTLGRRFSEKRKEGKRGELRRNISAPREARDGVAEVLERSGSVKRMGSQRGQGAGERPQAVKRYSTTRDEGVQTDEWTAAVGDSGNVGDKRAGRVYDYE